MKKNTGKGKVAKRIIITGVATVAGIFGGMKVYSSMKKRQQALPASEQPETESVEKA